MSDVDYADIISCYVAAAAKMPRHCAVVFRASRR